VEINPPNPALTFEVFDNLRCETPRPVRRFLALHVAANSIDHFERTQKFLQLFPVSARVTVKLAVQ
jgi:hypothetical protein